MESYKNINISNSTIIRVILFAALLFVLWEIKSLVLIVLTSVVIASFVESGILWMKKWGVGRVLSVVIIYLFSLILISGLFYILVPTLANEITALYQGVRMYIPNIDLLDSASRAKDMSIFSSIGDKDFGDIANSLNRMTQNVSSGFFGTIISIFGGIANAVLILVISFFLSIEEKGIEKFLRIVTPLVHEEYVISIWSRTQKKISKWIQGQMLLGLIVGLLAFVGLAILGVQYALLLAIVVAVFELVPFGMILAAVPAIAISFVDGGVSLGIMVTVFFVLLQQFENYILVPLIIRRSTGLPPLVVILSLLVGAKLAGFWGVILAVPVAVFLLEFLTDLEIKKFGKKI